MWCFPVKEEIKVEDIKEEVKEEIADQKEVKVKPDVLDLKEVKVKDELEVKEEIKEEVKEEIVSFLCQLTCQSADILSWVCGVRVRVTIFSETTSPTDFLFVLKDSISSQLLKLFKASSSV